MSNHIFNIKGESVMIRRCAIFLLLLNSLFIPSGLNANQKLKVLHISFHIGCVKDFEHVARAEGLDLTSWYILESQESRERFDPKRDQGSAIYNIGHERAQRIWDANKDYFNQFDVIVTSDTAPLSRIFLQNGWDKGLIIWICNRFDYYDGASLDCDFPDAEYYDLFKKAARQKNVKVIGYTPYEHYYAAARGVNTGGCTIKPLGSLEREMRHSDVSFIPKKVDKENTIFIYPRLDERELAYVEKQCKKAGISYYSGRYNGPRDLQGFKGVIYFPYQWSNLALFEDLQLGIVHFVPSEKFITELVRSGKPVRYCTLDQFHMNEWYCAAHKGLIVYFDSWSDLKHKIKSTNYSSMKTKIVDFGRAHKERTLKQWHAVFDDFKILSHY